MAIKLDEARIQLLKVGPSLVLRSDNEGGNIRIYAPNSHTNCYEWDAYNGNLRLYYSTNSGNGAAASWLFLNDGAIQAAKFKGPLEGNATSATKATQDSDGNTINTTYLKKSGGTMGDNAFINWPDSGSWGNANATFPLSRGGLYWSGTSDQIRLFAEETKSDMLNLVAQFGDDGNSGIEIRNQSGTTTVSLYATGTINATTFNGALTGNASSANKLIMWSDSVTNANTPGLYVLPASGSAVGNTSNYSVDTPNTYNNVVCYGTILRIKYNNPNIYYTDIYSDTNNNALLYKTVANGSSMGWRRILDSGNYTDYTVKKDGTGASGNWGISAEKLTTPRAINGTNFDGSSAITTANWGTARTITIGNTGKSVNGSGNVSWSLSEIAGNNSFVFAKPSVSTGTMNDAAKFYNAMGMICLTNPTSGTATNVNPNGKTGWHHFINLSYADGGTGSNSWITQIANPAGTTDLWVRSRSGGTISDSNVWVAPWTRIVTGSNFTSVLNGTYINTSGDTMTGALNFANGVWNNVGDDAAMGDAHQRGMICIKGLNGATGIYFTPYSGSTAQKISINGSGTMTITGTVASTFSGSLTGNATTATTASKLGSATIGNTLTPIYLNGGTATVCETFNNRLYDYNKARVYHYSFGGGQDLNWKKVFAASHTATAPSSAAYVGATIKGTIYHHKGNYNQAEVDEYPFQMNMMFLSGTSVTNSCTLRVAAGCPDTIIRAVRVATNSFELQVRQPADWQAITIQFSYSGGASTMQAFAPANSSNASVIAFATLSNSRTNIANQAVTLARGGDTNYPMKFYWSGQSGQPSWLWGGNDGGNMYVYNPSNFNVNYANSAGSVAWNNVSGKPSTFTPSSHSHNYITSSGTMTMISGTAKWANGFTVGNIYSSGYPFSYGTTWMYQGTFGAELIFNGLGGDAGVGTGHMYFRTRSDWPTSTWGDWKHLLDSSNYTTYTVKKDGTGASGTWGINITGNAATSTTATSATKDGESNTIHNTYLKKSGGTVSGQVSSSVNVTPANAAFRNIKVVAPSTTITAGTTAIPDGEIWIRYE